MNSVPTEQEAFAAALACATPAERDTCLNACCGDDTALRQRVEALLRASEEVGNFLEEPPTGLSAGVDVNLSLDEISEKPGDRIGRYKLLEEIGQGGCGVVYMEEQEQPVRRRVALKVIKPGMDTRAVVARFESVDIDTRSDIYSLGVLLYELLTSRTPFGGDELLRSGFDEMRRIIRSEEPPRPSTRLGSLKAAEATALCAKRKEKTLPSRISVHF